MTQHPLQRLSSPSTTLSLVLHLLGFASFSYSFYFLTTWLTPIDDAYGWHFQFFTTPALAVSFICFGLGVLADITSSSFLFQAKNTVSVLATPLEDYVNFPFWEDMSFHLAPAGFLVLDLLLFSPPRTTPLYGVMSLDIGYAFAYWYWVEVCFSKNGWYPYALFELLTTSQRILLFTFAAFLYTVSSSILKWLYAVLNGYPTAAKEAHKPLKKVQ